MPQRSSSDLGPILNANGWAVNAKSLVNVKFGKTLTSLAKFPKLTAVDAAARAKLTRSWILWILALLFIAAGVLIGLGVVKLW